MFCHAPLGANEAVEHFPVGRRLAFDSAKGRLWAVCAKCERWNLTPLEERWEAIEECERQFRDTKLRVSTENIGLARLKEGTTLVRVGSPQRPEMAAWRYGDQFGRRRRSSLLKGAAWTTVLGGGVGMYVLGSAFGVSLGLAGSLSFQAPQWFFQWKLRRTAMRLLVRGRVLRLSPIMIDKVALHPNEASGFALEFSHKRVLADDASGTRRFLPRLIASRDEPSVVVTGDNALGIARQVLPWINRMGAKRRELAAAVDILGASSGASHLFAHTAFVERSRSLATLPASHRLALEMSLHEDDERRALEGELAELADRWREAEEIAAISDDMFLPASVDAELDRLKRGYG